MREAAEQVDQFCFAQRFCNRIIVRAGFVNQQQGLNIPRAETLKPADAVASRAEVVAVGRGSCGDDAKRGVESAGEFERAQVWFAHPPAEFRSAFE